VYEGGDGGYLVTLTSTKGERLMIGALILGLFAGAVGRAIVPNDAFEGMHGPRSWLVSVVLGLVGAALGWAVFTAWLGIGDTDMFDWGGVVGALIGVVVVLLLVGFLARRMGGRPGSPTAGRARG
jgi:uncharacterized membrane protein YeaQ/YmgE (transglycosylase-associated protein family)